MKLVKIQNYDNDKLLVKKSRGQLTIFDIQGALRDAENDKTYALFLRAGEFNGWIGEADIVSSVLMVDIEDYHNCPVCGKALEILRTLLYEQGFQDGIASCQNNTESEKRKIGPPLKRNRIDWKSVDWSKNNSVLAREIGVTRQAVKAQRSKAR
jgi:hypothetical protein